MVAWVLEWVGRGQEENLCSVSGMFGKKIERNESVLQVMGGKISNWERLLAGYLSIFHGMVGEWVILDMLWRKILCRYW